MGRLDLDIGPFQDALDSSDGALGAAGDKMSSTAKVIGAGIGAAIAFSLASAINADAANSKLKAQLGLTEAESAKLGQTAGKLYASNYGESLGDVNDALAAVIRNVDGMSTATEAELQGVTAKVLDLSSAFGVDLAASARTVGTLMRTGMAKDATEALDIITKGLQSPVNAADDLLDTFDEYSTVFRTLGLDGADALGLLQQGLQGGARDADQIADSLKELQIRVQAGDAAAGLRAIGLDAKAMGEALSAGGDTARTATEAIITAFNGVANPADKAQLSIALFGTKAEDAQLALGNLDLTTAASDFEALNGPINGAAAAMDAALGDTRTAGIDLFKRSVEGAATAFGTALLPIVDIGLTSLSGLMEIVSGVVDFFNGLPLPLQLAAAAAVTVGIAFTGAGAAMKAAFLANPIGIAIVGITTALGFLVGSTESAADKQSEHKAVVDGLTATLDKNTGAITENTRASVVNDIGPARLRELKQLGITTGDYTDAILGNAAAQKVVAREVTSGIAAQIQAGEGYGALTKQMQDAGVSAQALGAAFVSGDYSKINSDLAGLNATIYDTGDGLLTIQNADGSAVVLADMAGKADTLRGAYGELEDRTRTTTEAQADYLTTLEASRGGAQEWATVGKRMDDVLGGVGSSAAATAVNMGELAAGTAAATPPLSEMEAAFAGVDKTASDADNSVKFFNISINAMMGINTTAQEATKLLNDAVRSSAEAFKAASEATNGNTSSLVSASGQIDTTTEAGSKLYDGLQDIAGAYDVTTTAAYDNAVQNGNTAGALGAAQAAAQAARDSFLRNAAAMGLNDQQAALLADSLGIVEGKKLTDKNFAVHAQGLIPAGHDIAILDAQQIRDKSFKVTANFVASNVATAVNSAANSILNAVGLAEGGAVYGSGPKGVDSVRTILAPGEHVLTDEDVDALGGQSGVYAFRRALQYGGADAAAASIDPFAGYVPAAIASPGPAAVGAGASAGNTYSVVVQHYGNGEVVPEKLMRALRELERTGRY